MIMLIVIGIQFFSTFFLCNMKSLSQYGYAVTFLLLNTGYNFTVFDFMSMFIHLSLWWCGMQVFFTGIMHILFNSFICLDIIKKLLVAVVVMVVSSSRSGGISSSMIIIVHILIVIVILLLLFLFLLFIILL